ncbi:MAG TPA: aldo/keto reductase [Pseudonocardiaceae bacterium]|nr:aldo/keto reductase [Pseudonocardiaceae bacterium]
MGVGTIDLYHLHRPDPMVPIEESVGALAELRQAGKIGEIGVSNVDLIQLCAAERVAPITSAQNRFSLFDQAGRDVLDHCTADGIAFLAYSPLRGVPSPALARVLGATAEAHQVTTAHIALAWLLASPPW